jgi:arsenate reductase
MAHGYLNHFGGNNVEVYSAGIESQGVNPSAISVMKEDGIDISHHTSNSIEEYKNLDFDFVLTVCDFADENCPSVPARVKALHYNFPDPAKARGNHAQIMEQFRITRDMIRKYTRDFIQSYINVTS